MPKASQVAPQPLVDSTESCRFYMIKADFIRAYSGVKLPFFQEIRSKHPEAIVEVTITYAEVVRGRHVEKILSVSHRWMTAQDPDPDGEQLKAIKTFLASNKGREIELVWIDAASMPQDQPQGSRSAPDTADFKTMLSQVNMLYLGTQVLILLDLSYVSRFWTQFEAWLSMQFATPNGLKSAVGNTRNERHHIAAIQNAAEQAELHKRMLIQSWADKTPQQAFEFLSKPDVTVTNQSDKDGQLPKIKSLGETVQSAFKAVDTQLQQQVVAAEGQVLHAQAALEAWEAENHVEAAAQAPTKVADAERELVAARAAKELHQRAIVHGMRPM